MSIRRSGSISSLLTTALLSGTALSGVGARPSSTVTIYKNGVPAGTAGANASGAWSYTFGSAPVAGDDIGYFDGVSAGRHTTVPPAAAGIVRADATNADVANVIPAAGGASYATTTRAPLYCQNAIKAGTTVVLEIPLWAFTASGTILELDLPQAYDFAAAIEVPYAQATTGLNPANRYPASVVGGSGRVFHYTVGGQTVSAAQFAVVWPVDTAARTAIGGWLTHECVAGRTAAVSNVQIQMATQMANGIQRYAGAIQTQARATAISAITNNGTNGVATVADMSLLAVGAPFAIGGADVATYNGNWVVSALNSSAKTVTFALGSSGVAAATTGTLDPGHIAGNAVTTATAVTPYAAAGGTALMQIGAVLLPFAAGSSIESWLSNGNSKEAGNFEGVNGLTTPDGVVHGDRGGDAYGNRGMPTRLGWALNMAVAQGAKGSDRDGWRLIVPSYTASIAGTAMTVTAMTSGLVWPGQQVIGAAAGTVITGATVFTASVSGTLLTVSAVSTSATPLAAGQVVFSNGAAVGTIASFGSGSGGVGTYNLAAAGASVSGALMTSNAFVLNTSQTVSPAAPFTAQGNYARRQAWQATLNPHRVIDMNPTNELGSGTVAAVAYTPNSAVALDAVRYTGGNFYICDQAGTTGGASAPTGTAIGQQYADGGVLWSWIGPQDFGGAAANTQADYGAGWVGTRRKRLRLDKAALPNAKFYGVTQTPLTAAYAETLASGAYAYNAGTGVLSFTVATAARFSNGSDVLISGLAPAGMNGYLPATVSGSTVSVTVATGLAAPTGTATLSNVWTDTAGQTIQSAYAAFAAPGTSMRSWVNRFLRNQPLARSILGYVGVVDTAKYVEAGNPVTPAAETGVWATVNDTGGHACNQTAEGGHENSLGYQTEVSAALNDSTLMAALTA